MSHYGNSGSFLDCSAHLSTQGIQPEEQAGNTPSSPKNPPGSLPLDHSKQSWRTYVLSLLLWNCLSSSYTRPWWLLPGSEPDRPGPVSGALTLATTSAGVCSPRDSRGFIFEWLFVCWPYLNFSLYLEPCSQSLLCFLLSMTHQHTNTFFLLTVHFPHQDKPFCIAYLLLVRKNPSVQTVFKALTELENLRIACVPQSNKNG